MTPETWTPAVIYAAPGTTHTQAPTYFSQFIHVTPHTPPPTNHTPMPLFSSLSVGAVGFRKNIQNFRKLAHFFLSRHASNFSPSHICSLDRLTKKKNTAASAPPAMQTGSFMTMTNPFYSGRDYSAAMPQKGI